MFRGYHMLYFENIYKLGNIVHCFHKTRQDKVSNDTCFPAHVKIYREYREVGMSCEDVLM